MANIDADQSGRPLRAVLFDCDGTLVDGQHEVIATMVETFAESGLPEPDANSVRRIIGLDLAEGIDRVLPAGSGHDPVQLAFRYKELFGRRRMEGRVFEPMYDGIRDLIDTLDDAGYLLGIVTGKSTRGLHQVLATHGLEGRFQSLQTNDMGPSKPHPSMVYRALAELGVETDNAVVVGDTTYDMMMARTAGAYAIGVSWGYHPVDELQHAGAHALVETVPDLEQAINRLIGRLG